MKAKIVLSHSNFKSIIYSYPRTTQLNGVKVTVLRVHVTRWSTIAIDNNSSGPSRLPRANDPAESTTIHARNNETLSEGGSTLWTMKIDPGLRIFVIEE